MRAIHFDPEPRTVQVGRPVFGPGQILIRVELVGVHLGLLRAPVPTDPGAEVVGIVAEVGADLPRSWLGTRVGGVVFAGAYAEYAVAEPFSLTEIPADVDSTAALAVVRGGLVALGALRAGQLTAGESVLITAAASGVGHLALQIARALGATRVLAAAGSVDKAAFLRECGADVVLGYDDSWSEQVDVVADGVGGALIARGIAALAPHGRLVAFAAVPGDVDSGSLLAGSKTVTGFAVGHLPSTTLDDYRTQLWTWLRDGSIRPRYRVLPEAEVGAALESVAARRNTGRVILRMTTAR